LEKAGTRMKKTICNYDCLNCIYPDCINDYVEPDTPYYKWKNGHPDAYRRQIERGRATAAARYRRLKDQGICVTCGQAKAVSGVRCERCAEVQRISQKQRRTAV